LRIPEALQDRVHPLNDRPVRAGPVVYWMSRDQRTEDNWALLYAQKRAMVAGAPLFVVFTLAPDFLGATMRHYGFMLRGLEEVEGQLLRNNISFVLLAGDPVRKLPGFLESSGAGMLVTDFDPLKVKVKWRTAVAATCKARVFEVDTHNIVPCRKASEKKEFGAYTIRPKVNRLLDRYLLPFPRLKKHPFGEAGLQERVDWKSISSGLKIDRSVGEVSWITPGQKAARGALRAFLADGLGRYDEDRNDPSATGQSGLSPWLHFGHLSAQRIALEVKGSGTDPERCEGFLEELIVRRELSDNFCFYNSSYDSVAGFPDWALKTLDAHRDDPRPYLYSLTQFENARTHDPCWNAAQRQMVREGKMHGYMRMYWAKKILEWTSSPEEAMDIAIYLNDRYELDGRDPNGYTGIAWSIGGVHDRAWGERPVFGKIRYMNDKGLKRKFNMAPYLARYGEQ
jgi:deoxyribodipyrimidine photo-lyase